MTMSPWSNPVANHNHQNLVHFTGCGTQKAEDEILKDSNTGQEDPGPCI